MKPIYLASGGAVCHTGRGLTALSQGLNQPDPQPLIQTIEEITPALSAPYLPALIETNDNRSMALVEAAVSDALAGFSYTDRQGMALFVASSTADLIGREADYAVAVHGGESPLAWTQPSAGLLAKTIAEKFGLTGGQYTINTACSSGLHTLMYAAAAIRNGDCERAMVVGLECPGRVTFAGFQSLLLMTQDECRPFDRNRDGMMLGETAAAMVLDANSNGPDFEHMQMLGSASACDTSSITQANSEAVRSIIAAAMHSANVTHVDAIKAHGTGTPDNDIAEAAGIADCMSVEKLPMTSIKPTVGHTLGACGVLETLAMAVCWRSGLFPPTVGFQTQDSDVAIRPVTQTQHLPPGRMLLNYFGFGGNNGALILEYAP